MGDENKEAIADENALGEFPFPLATGPEESRYLTWLRNHSNYMATRGFLDYFRMVGVLVRGILINFLILLSLLLAASLVIGHLYGPQLRSLPSSDDLTLDLILPKLEPLASRLKQTLFHPSDDEEQRPVDKWLAEHLSDETKAALTAKGGRPEDLQLALSKDLRDLIAGESILAALAKVKVAVGKEQLKPKELEERVKAEVQRDKERLKAVAKREQGRLNAQRKEELAKEAAKFEWLAETIKPLLEWLPKTIKPLLEKLHKTWWGDWMKTLSDKSRSQLRFYNRLALEDEYPGIRKLASSAGPFYETGILPPMPVPFTLTRSVLLLALLVILFSPILVLYREIAGHKKSIEKAGSDSSVNRRDKFERFFGWVLLAILAVALFEALPVLVDKFHQFRVSPEMNWNAIFASMAGVSLAVLGGASKLLSVLGGVKKKLAMLLIGLLGLLVPLLVILYVTEFLIYHAPPEGLFGNLHLVLPIGFIALIVIGMLVGKRSFEFSEKVRLSTLLVAVFVGTIAAWFFLEFYRVRGFGHEWNFWFIAIGALELWFFCRLVVDVNRTSIHGLYRDRLASAYLVGLDTKGDVDIEEDINLGEIGWHEAGSTAPYHLVNVTLNLQGSKDPSIRDRNSDFFIFSKRFIGGDRTGYCRTETMEQVHPEMNLATAMAISAAAASPNMGRSTNPMMVAFMVLLNIRLGYWLPNPGLLEEKFRRNGFFAALATFGTFVWKKIRREPKTSETTPSGFTFEEVFKQELVDIEKRWDNVYSNPSERKQRKLHSTTGRTTAPPTTKHGLVGLGFSGGGIRSATFNLGIAQALHKCGVFDHVDYMSTVSGGGYLGSSISTLMRWRGVSDMAGTLNISTDEETGEKIVRVTRTPSDLGQREYRFSKLVKLDDAVRDGAKVEAGQRLVRSSGPRTRSEVAGKVSVKTYTDTGNQIVTVTGRRAPSEPHEYEFSRFDTLVVETGDEVKAGQELIKRHNALWDRFSWRVKPFNLVREMLMKLDETHKWVNLSDGGHIENLAGIELLRRRCKFIIIGDGEADPELAFNGLATLIRYARIDLGIHIEINPEKIRVKKNKKAVDQGKDNLSEEHFAFGTITYPPNNDNKQPEEGYLLYLKSSYSGDEDEVIKEYRHRNPTFPHQSTADQFFDENQFECYRALGQHIGEQALQHIAIVASGPTDSPHMTFEKFEDGLKTLGKIPAMLAERALEAKVKKMWETWMPTEGKQDE